MSVNNKIATREPMRDKAIEYMAGEDTVRLSPSIVRSFLVSGDGRVTDQEVAMFINLCKYQRLNPLIRDAYLIKSGNNPAAIVTGKDAILKRAMRNPRYAGHQAGVIVQSQETGELEYRVGSFVLQDENLIGGWGKTYVKGYDVPIETAVSFDEYAGRKRDGSLNDMWRKKPGVMIRKVAMVTSLREAFPEDLGGLYASEEVGESPEMEEIGPIDVDQIEPTETQQEEPKSESYAQPDSSQIPLEFPGNF